jgi:hypothetical protein
MITLKRFLRKQFFILCFLKLPFSSLTEVAKVEQPQIDDLDTLYYGLHQFKTIFKKKIFYTLFHGTPVFSPRRGGKSGATSNS